jgi:hypothetical protein
LGLEIPDTLHFTEADVPAKSREQILRQGLWPRNNIFLTKIRVKTELGFGAYHEKLKRSREDSNPPEYPVNLLDPQTCARELLRRIYANKPKTIPVDRDARNVEIFLQHLEGKSTAELAEIYNLTVQRIRAIIRKMSK